MTEQGEKRKSWQSVLNIPSPHFTKSEKRRSVEHSDESDELMQKFVDGLKGKIESTKIAITHKEDQLAQIKSSIKSLKKIEDENKNSIKELYDSLKEINGALEIIEKIGSKYKFIPK